MRIFLDENLSEHVADALNLLNRGYFQGIEVVSTKKAFGAGKADEEIIPPIGQERGVLITRDFKIGSERAKIQMCNKYDLGVVFLRLPKGSTRHWGLVELLIKHWTGIIHLCSGNRRPFFARISPRSGLENI